MRFALIHNARSRKNRRSGSVFAAEAKALLGENFVPSDSREGMTEHVRHLCKRDVRTIVIDGGDGTVSTALTAIARVYPADRLPDIAVLASGNTNLIANDVGFGLRGMEAIRRLQRGAAMRSSIRTPIRLSWPETDRSPVLGLFGGCTGYARAVRIAHSPTVVRFAPHDLAVGFTLLSTVISLMFRKSRESWLSGEALRVETSGHAYDGNSFMFLTTGLSKLSRGIWPFWDAEPNVEGLRYLDVGAHPENLSRATAALLCGRAPRWLRRHPDYVSGRTDDMILTTKSDFVLDGEVFTPSEHEQMRLERGPAFRFLHA
ncbi:acylglycerol kinase family protein [Gluconobacter frateurii]|uniref:diacylglycerol/lipid kinase family protein n=1 Tax=Gluconobacter frateurii TaxID=38308 RepID=UPI001F061182|nr:acylglycerol kinase family protein [Gluconobacter frateurii]UMM07672.1 acylglycerol kinase family protein [Gluconobacter frateurii]